MKTSAHQLSETFQTATATVVRERPTDLYHQVTGLNNVETQLSTLEFFNSLTKFFSKNKFEKYCTVSIASCAYIELLLTTKICWWLEFENFVWVTIASYHEKAVIDD